MSKKINISLPLLLLILSVNFQLAFSQTKYNVIGKLIDNQNNKIFSASVSLLSNNKIYAYAISNDEGYFEIKTIPEGNYFLKINSLGYKLYYKSIKISHDINLGNIILMEDISKLGEVVLKLPPKTIIQNSKGVVLNVAETPLVKKETSLDILKMSPNVSFINGLEILGSKRIKITINGQDLHIQPDKIKTFIQTIKPENIKKIEIIDGGDANFEGEQDAQINIFTINKKGFMSELETSISYNKTNGFGNDDNISLNYRKNKWNFFVNTYFDRHKQSYTDSIKTNINNIIFYDKNGKGNLKRHTLNFSSGVNYEFDHLSSLGFLYNYENDIDKNHHYISSNKIATQSTYDSLIMSNRMFDNHYVTQSFSAQYKQKLDTLESVFMINAQYVLDNFHIPLQETEAFYKNSILKNQTKFVTDYKNISHLYGIKSEWDKNFTNNTELLIGTKLASINIKDKNLYTDLINNSNNLYNPLLFRQNVLAGYINYYFNIGKYKFSTGLRSEYTLNNFGLQNTDENHNENIRLLPNLKVSRKFKKNHYLMMYLTQKISRPSYYSFNPNIEIVDRQNRNIGNPDLKPVETYRFVTTYYYKQKYALMFRYDYSLNNILYFSKYFVTEGYTLTKPVNTGKRKYILFLISIPVRFSKWWKTTNKIYYTHTDFKTDLFPNQSFSSDFFGLSTNQNIDLSKHSQIYINAYYTGRNKFLNTTYEPNYNINISFATIPFKNAKLFIGINDIFDTSRNKYTSVNNKIITKKYSKYTTRSVYLKLRYNFNWGKNVNTEEPEQILKDEEKRSGK